MYAHRYKTEEQQKTQTIAMQVNANTCLFCRLYDLGKGHQMSKGQNPVSLCLFCPSTN